MLHGHSNPFKSLLTILYLGAVIAVAFGFVIAFSWMLNHIYTVIWFLLVLAVFFWLVLSIYDTFKSKLFQDEDDNTPLPSETFEG